MPSNDIILDPDVFHIFDLQHFLIWNLGLTFARISGFKFFKSSLENLIFFRPPPPLLPCLIFLRFSHLWFWSHLVSIFARRPFGKSSFQIIIERRCCPSHLHCTALHCTALHCTILHCTALHYSSLHWMILQKIQLHSPSPTSTALHWNELFYTTLSQLPWKGSTETWLHPAKMH